MLGYDYFNKELKQRRAKGLCDVGSGGYLHVVSKCLCVTLNRMIRKALAEAIPLR